MENSNSNKIKITNCLALNNNPFSLLTPDSFAHFGIDETYEGKDSEFSYKYSVDSNGLLFCELTSLSSGIKNKVLINYPNSITEISEDTAVLNSPFDISSMFTEDYILGKDCIYAYKTTVQDCKTVTGLTTLPEGKSLYYTKYLSAVMNKDNHEKLAKRLSNGHVIQVNLSEFKLSDYSDIYQIIRSLAYDYYIFMADTISE